MRQNILHPVKMAAAKLCKFIRTKQILTIRQMTVKRQFISKVEEAFAITYSDHGDPKKVLEGKILTLPKVTDSDVLIKMLMASVNPADINMIQGTYHLKPPLPATAGNEGVGEIIEVGKNVTHLCSGDWAMPVSGGWGTWRTYAVCPGTELQRVPNDIPLLSAATLAVNPCTAYRMLKDFVDLKPGDALMQNGANSAVGQAIIQLATASGIKTINIIRNRPEIDVVSSHLKNLGATHVVTQDFCKTQGMKQLISKLSSPPKLGLNCIGGKSATEMLRYLAPKSVMVTYGGMSREPVTVPTGVFIFKQIKLVGFWMTQWNTENKDNPEKAKMMSELCDLVRECRLIPPACELIPIRSFKNAVVKSLGGFVGQKQVLVMNDSLTEE